MHQGRGRTRRRVAFGPAQAPFGRGPRELQAIDRAPERPDLRVSGLRIGFAEKREVVLGRANGMDLRQLAPELLGKADAIAAERFVLGDARPQADPFDQAHHGERRADYLGIVAEPDRLRRAHAGAIGGREDRELLGPGPARCDGRRGVFPQHELARLPPATDDAPDAPVLLDRPAAHRLNGLDDEVVRSQTSTDPGLQLRCMVLIKHKRKLARERRLAKSSARRRFAPHGPSGPSLCCYASIQAKPVASHNAGLASYAVLCLGQRHPPTPTASAGTMRRKPIQAPSRSTIYKLDTR